LALIIGDCVLDRLGDSRRDAQQLTQLGDICGAGAIAEEAIVANAVEALGEDVLVRWHKADQTLHRSICVSCRRYN
jgi:hypothetical protein